jgi:hypothetical protein
MFALIAAIIWFLAAFGLTAGSINLPLLGLAFLALYFATGWGLSMPSTWHRQPPA